MRTRRGMIVILASAILVTGTAAVVAMLFWPSLPDPAVADRDELLRWLVVRDLGAESPETRRVLAVRLDEEFSTGIDWETKGERLDESQRRRLWSNALLLIEPWLTDKTECYHALAASERIAYLDKVIDTITVWRGIDSLCPRQSDAAGGQGGFLAALLEQSEKQKQEASARERQRISQFILAIQSRWLLRSLWQLMPKGVEGAASGPLKESCATACLQAVPLSCA